MCKAKNAWEYCLGRQEVLANKLQDTKRLFAEYPGMFYIFSHARRPTKLYQNTGSG